MKNNVLKFQKSFISLLVALVILAVSMFSQSINIKTGATATTDTWDGTYTQPTVTDEEENIIISTAEELAWAVLKSGTASSGVTYKVADGITAFYMNENTADLTLSQVKNKLDGNSTNVWEYQGNYFQGTLDGNGVTVYGLYSSGENSNGNNDGGLIPYATGDVAVKNIAVKNSYIGSYKYASAIITNTTDSLASLTVQQCTVSNNYITQIRNTQSSGGSNYAVGAICGYVGASELNCTVKIDNCLVFGNELYSTSKSNNSGTIAHFNANSNNASTGCYKFSNLVISGAAPWCGNYSYYGRLKSNFSNVYIDTDASDFIFTGNLASTNPNGFPSEWCTVSNGFVEKLDTANMQGEAAKNNMSALGWGNVWKANEGSFPSLRIFSADDTDNEGDTSTTFDTDTWDGTIATSFASGSGAMSDPYIIETAEQLAYLASGANGSTGGKYYKVADGIKAFDMCGFDGITLDSTLEDVKAATKTGNDWSIVFNESNAFCGVFDGNEAIVYNLYGKTNAMGLFPCIKGYDDSTVENITIKNITVKNSYFEATGSGYNYGAGGIFGKHTNSGTAYPVTISKCAVINCYITNTNSTAAAYAATVGGTVRWATAVIDNCLSADNEVVGGTVSTGGFVAAAQNSSAITASNCVVIGTTPYPTGTQGTGVEHTNFTDLIAPASYTNIYTDQTVSSTYTGITTLTRAQMTGTSAMSNMISLDWGSNWKTQENSYPIPFNPVVAEGIWDGKSADSYAGGDGTENNPFIIECAAQLYKMVVECGEDANGNPAYFKVKDGVYDIFCNPIEELATAVEIRAYFEDPTTYKASWNPQVTEFNGNFDGNGVTIHGLYNLGSSSSGLAFLPRVSNSTAIVKNVEFNGCYFKNTADFGYWSCASVVVGRASDSTVTLKNIAVVNSTAISTTSSAGILLGVTVADATVDTAFTSGNTISSNRTIALGGVEYPYAGIVYGSCFSGDYDPPMSVTVKNSVFTETDLQLTNIGYKIGGESGYGVFEMYVAGKTVESITGIDSPVLMQSKMKGESAKNNMPDLDWTKWIVTDSYPVIAALHDLSYTQNGDNGHGISCNDCEDVSVGLEAHTYDNNYICVLCGFEHSHTLVDSGIDYDATCVDNGVMNVKCEYCDYTSTREICAKNHTFGEVIPATVGDCKTEATQAYKTCSVCELAFTPDADNTSSTPLDHIGTGYTARHNWIAQEDFVSKKTGKAVPCSKCSVCDMYLVEGVMTETAPANSLAGDANADGKVNNKDLGILIQYLNDWDVTIDLETMDVNADSKVNNKDLGLLIQYLNDWDVVLK